MAPGKAPSDIHGPRQQAAKRSEHDQCFSSHRKGVVCRKMIGVVRGVSKDQHEELGFRVGCIQHKIPAQPQSYPGSVLRTLGLSEPLSPDL